MAGKPDPRKPKRNPELRDIERVVRNNWAGFKGEKDHTRKRGYAMVLGAALEQWLDEPEYLTDLADGAVPPPEPTRPDPGLVEGAETLCEVPGETENTFFWLSPGNVPTTLFVGRDGAPFDSRELSGFVVRLFEKVFATGNETVNHFTSEAALRRHVGREPPGPLERGMFFVLCDPRGYYDGRSAMTVAKYKTLSSAKKRAEALAEDFGIRFALACLVGWVDNH